MGLVEIIKGWIYRRSERLESPSKENPDFPGNSGRADEIVLNAYLEWGSQVVRVKEHLLIGRYHPRRGRGGRNEELIGTVECYGKRDKGYGDQPPCRPLVRFLAKHQLVVPDNIPDRERISISRHHALVLYTPTSTFPLYIIDPQSTAGVWVNRTRIQIHPDIDGISEGVMGDALIKSMLYAHPLQHGDMIHFQNPERNPAFFLHVVIPEEKRADCLPVTEIKGERYSFFN